MVTFERGRYYTPSISNEAARSFSEATEEERRRAEEVRKALRGAKTIEQIQRELAEARTLESAALLDVVSDLMKHSDPMVRTLALTLIEGINSPALVNPLREAFADPSAEVRIQAMEVAQHLIDPAVRDLIESRMEALVGATARAYGAEARLDFRRNYPVTVNDPARAGFAARVAADVVGEARVDDATPPIMGGEDFAYMLEARPGAFIYIGNGDTAGVHHPAYNFNDDAIPSGVSFWAKLAETAMPAR